MNTQSLLNIDIENIDRVYGGIRGTTLSSHRNLKYWPLIVECGIKTIIELRRDDHSERLCALCERYGIRYFAIPIDSHSTADAHIAELLAEFFRVIDEGNFYIACAMGLHRTDIALSIYWMFHGADLGLAPPYLKGHTYNGELKLANINNKIIRRLNSLYRYLQENPIIPIPDEATFKQRKAILQTNII